MRQIERVPSRIPRYYEYIDGYKVAEQGVDANRYGWRTGVGPDIVDVCPGRTARRQDRLCRTRREEGHHFAHRIHHPTTTASRARVSRSKTTTRRKNSSISVFRWRKCGSRKAMIRLQLEVYYGWPITIFRAFYCRSCRRCPGEGRRCRKIARGLVSSSTQARIDDRLRGGRLPAQRDPHRADANHARFDGLAQYLVVKRWRKWLLVVGSHEIGQALWRDALRRVRCAVRGQDRARAGVRRYRRRACVGTDSGCSFQIQRQMPLFLQGAPDHDVLVAADESDVFASYLPYRTREPRSRRVGSAGLCSLGRAGTRRPRPMGRQSIAEPVQSRCSRAA